jgi:hypothetical protein
MKTVELRLVKELARLTRKYEMTGDVDLLSKKNNIAFELSKQAFHDDMHWTEFKDVCEIVCGISPLKKDGTINDIIGILNLLDIEVVDDIESEE